MDVNKSQNSHLLSFVMHCFVRIFDSIRIVILGELKEIVKYENLIMDKRSTITELRKSKNSYEYLEKIYKCTHHIPDSMYEDSIIIELQNHKG